MSCSIRARGFTYSVPQERSIWKTCLPALLVPCRMGACSEGSNWYFIAVLSLNERQFETLIHGHWRLRDLSKTAYFVNRQQAPSCRRVRVQKGSQSYLTLSCNTD